MSDREPIVEVASQLSRQEVLEMRERYMSPSLRSFVMMPEDPMVFTRGEGQYIFDAEGKRYIDLMAQNLCISLGYCNPITVAMVEHQLHKIQHVTSMYLNEMSVLYAKELVERMPEGTDWVVHPVNSGSEAVDLAFQMARVFTRNFEILTLRNGYHGVQGTALGAVGIGAFRSPVPTPPGFVSVYNPDQYRGVFGPGVDPYIEDIQRTIASCTCGQLAGMIIEPIQGYGGAVPMPDGYMKRAFDLVRKAGGLAIVDEVQTGFGRTGAHYWGFQAHDAQPDIVVMGKGMGNGFPMAGVVARRDVAEAFAKYTFFNTYGLNTIATAAARSVLKVIDEDGMQENARRCGDRLRAGLKELQQRYEIIGDVRGSGLMMGVEIVRERGSVEPDRQKAEKVHYKLREQGVNTNRGSANKNTFRINPPLCVTLDDVDRVLDAFDRALKTVS